MKKVILFGVLAAVIALLIYFSMPIVSDLITNGKNSDKERVELSEDNSKETTENISDEDASDTVENADSGSDISDSSDSSLSDADSSETETSKNNGEAESTEDEENKGSVENPQDVSFTFTATGDNLIHSYIYQQSLARGRNGHYAFSRCYQDVSNFFKNNDLNWINQETLCTDTLEPSSYPCFSTPGDCARALYKMNMRVFNISTNHTYDKGTTGLNDMMDFWNNRMPDDALATGVYSKRRLMKLPIYNYEGTKIAFLSYTYGTNGIPTPEDSKTRVIFLNEEKLIRRQIKKARRVADVVIVSAHWGVEDSHVVTDDQRKLARRMTSWGADLIVGTHPHVIQDAEWVQARNGRKAFCMYSLGNFISGQIVADNILGLTFRCYIMIKHTRRGRAVVKIRRPRLYPSVTVYGPGHIDEHVEWLRDYSEADSLNHGIRANDSRFNYEYIWNVFTENVDKKYLVMPARKK